MAADLSVAADPNAAADPSAVGDRYGEAAHTAAQIAVAVDLTSGAAQIVVAIPNVAAVQSAVVDRILAGVRNEPVDLIAAPNAAMNGAQIFPSVQLGRVSMVLQADRQAQNAETRIVLDC